MNQSPPHALLRPAVAIPFVLVALIWGSTWFVIKGQIGEVSAHWSVVYRFALATPGMFVLALAMRLPLAMPRRAHGLALAMGLFQFCGNYSFVYVAELDLTSGIVALLIGLMLVPNALLGRLLLGEPITRRFVLGSAVAIAGIALLLVNEAQVAPLDGNVARGAALAVAAMLVASIANVIQAGPAGKDVPLVSLLAWAMLYGTVLDGGVAWLLDGPPLLPRDSAYWLGTAWLALIGSVVTFPLYYGLVRQLGAGRAAYNGVLVLVVAMVISTVFEDYQWTPLAIGGAALALAGLVVALRARQVPVVIPESSPAEIAASPSR